ncbi:MAG: hypothetical protein AAGH38_02180 [Pseudomonadota bacterium]
MPYSLIERCNAALISLGARSVTSLTEESKEARLCAVRAEPVRDALLRSHPWNFAARQISLPLVVGDGELVNRFQLPSDCLIVRRVDAAEPDDWRVEGRLLVAPVEPPAAVGYTARVDDPTQWDALFAECFSAKLAAELAVAVTGSRTEEAHRQSQFRLKLIDAKRSDAQESGGASLRDGSWLEARVG